MLSAWGGAAVSFPIAENASPVTFNFEGGVVETPNIFWRNDYFNDELVTEAPAPGTRTSGYGAGSARVDFKVGDEGRATIRAGSKSIVVPSPSQVGHIPCGELNENDACDGGVNDTSHAPQA